MHRGHIRRGDPFSHGPSLKSSHVWTPKIQGGHHTRVSQSWEVSDLHTHSQLDAPKQALAPLCTSVSPHFMVGERDNS